MLEVINSIALPGLATDRRIELCRGDLANLSREDGVDLLVVSAFPDDYSPTALSLVGGLARGGVPVAELAAEKYYDVRETSSCWVSREIRGPYPDSAFDRLLCFEPLVRGQPAEVVGDIFRAMVPLLGPSGPRTAAMPIVATGDAGYPVGEMLDAILVAAGHWMALDVSLERLLIVQPPDSPRLAEALDAFERAKASHLPPDPRAGAKTFDFFVSYAHEDSSLADAVVETLRRSRPGIQIFLDRLSLSEGDPWQQELFTAMDWSRKVVALLSPNYIGSKMCLEEYNIARILDRESDERVLLPLYVHSADLATYMRAIQYRDCREADLAALRAACTDIADSI